MNNRKYLLSEQEDNNLMVAFTQCKEGEMRTKIQAVRLYGTNRPIKEIIDLTGLPTRTIHRWYKRYLELGISGFVDNRQGGNHKYLTDGQIQDLRQKLQQYRPIDLFPIEEIMTADGLHWTVPDLRRAVKMWYEITYKQDNSYRLLFGKCGFSYQRASQIYRSRSEKQVAEFEEAVEKN